MNSVETRLRSWELRAPSAKLKRHLFVARKEPTLPQLCGHILRWVAPASACLFLAVTLLNGGRTALDSKPFDRPGVLTLASNQIPNASGSERGGNIENTLSPASLGWTNGDAYTSSITSFLPAGFN
ncbi:MAG TPA: hypothetical protein VFM25_07775 [Verrucomicrobiae bacterium]|nr:hypothetical protein [Verrucomicrobiae bacterium]